MTTPPDPIPLNYESAPKKPPVRDDVAYVLPMATFLAFIWLGTKGADTGHGNTWYPWTYVARTIVVGAMLIAFRHAYTKIRWDHWLLGMVVGVMGIFQWVGMQLFLQNHFEFFKPSPDVFDPTKTFSSPATMWGSTWPAPPAGATVAARDTDERSGGIVTYLIAAPS